MQLTQTEIHQWKADNFFVYAAETAPTNDYYVTSRLAFKISLDGVYRVTLAARVIYHGPSITDALKTYKSFANQEH